jgi:1,6-anhydro-N-acetylmuramate kinase
VICDAGYTLGQVDSSDRTPDDLAHGLKGGHVSSTLQVTEAVVLAERTGITIKLAICSDVAAGGQGAPTAYVDWLPLRHPDHWRAVHHRGIGNVTFSPTV